MSRFRVDHPTRKGIHVIAGVDHMLGFFIEVFREGRERPIKSLDVFTNKSPVTLQACLDFMISEEFFTKDELESALLALEHPDHEQPLPTGIKRTIEVVMEFKGSAG